MMGFLQSVVAFLFALGVLITFHEFGHYWVARRCNVKILRFSIGFGRPLWKRCFGEDRTELVIAALPLGGYVKMLDEREGAVAGDERHRAFNNKPLAQRVAVVAAGPLFNFIFAVFAYSLIYMLGISGLKPMVGQVDVDSPAMQAGLEPGQQIMRVDGVPTPTWSAVVEKAVASVVDGRNLTLTILNRYGAEEERSLELAAVSIDEMAQGSLLEELGLHPQRPVYPAVLGEVAPDGAAAAAGLRPGDHILAVEGNKIEGWLAWVKVVRANPGRTLSVELSRSGERRVLSLTPAPVTGADGERTGLIGAAADPDLAPDPSLLAVERYGLFASIGKALVKTWDMSLMTLRILGKMLVGEASVKNLSGPVSIAHYAGTTAGIGLVAFLGFMAIVSVSLGVLNLLPVPLLDGGHLLYYIIEFVKGSPVSESVQITGQQIGIAILIGLMSIAFYNDIVRLAG